MSVPMATYCFGHETHWKECDILVEICMNGPRWNMFLNDCCKVGNGEQAPVILLRLLFPLFDS